MKIAELKKHMDARFDAVDARFEAVDARFEAADARFEAADARFETVNARFDAVDVRFEAVDARFDAVDVRFEAVDARFDAVDVQFEAVDARFDAIEARIQGEHETTRRHFDIRAEQMLTQLKLYSEHSAAMLQRIDAIHAENVQDHANFMRIFDNHEVRITSVEGKSG